MYRMVLVIFTAMFALSAPATANPLPIQPTGALCSPMMNPPPEVCAHLTETPTTPPAAPSTTGRPGQTALCPLHDADKALLSPSSTSPSTTSSQDDPLVLGGLRANLHAIRMVMCELHEEYKLFFDEGDLNTALSTRVLPNVSDFTPAWRNYSRHHDRAHHLMRHAALLTDYMRALDVLRQDQSQLNSRRICDLSRVDDVIGGMCRLLYGIHRILRICDVDPVELRQLDTAPSAGYQPPRSNFYTRMQDLVILREARHYTDVTEFDLAAMLDNGPDAPSTAIRTCSSLQSPDGSE